MPDCQSCGHHVSSDYVRVFSRGDTDQVYCCPWCEDTIRRNGQLDEAKVERTDPRAETRYEPEARM